VSLPGPAPRSPPRTMAPAWPSVLTATRGMVAMADALHPDLDDCFHCPQGDKPCPATYQPGAWLAQPPAQPPTNPAHGWPSHLPSQHLQAMTAPTVVARSKPAFRMPYAGCARPLQTIAGHLARLPTDMEGG
jgi:hypothetical protein